MIPKWLQDVIQTMQGQADTKYADGLAQYKAALAQWKVNAQRAFEMGLEIPKFTTPAPVKVVFGADGNNNLTQQNTVPPVEAAVFEPAPEKAVQPAVPFTTGAPAQSDKIDRMLQILESVFGSAVPK